MSWKIRRLLTKVAKHGEIHEKSYVKVHSYSIYGSPFVAPIDDQRDEDAMRLSRGANSMGQLPQDLRKDHVLGFAILTVS